MKILLSLNMYVFVYFSSCCGFSTDIYLNCVSKNKWTDNVYGKF